MKFKGFTLIELLVVISIIGVLATFAIASLGEARTRANIASIQTALHNFRTAAALYHLDNNTFEGLCNYSDNTVHPSVQPLIDKLKNISNDNRVRCVVRTSNVPSVHTNHFKVIDDLQEKNFGLAVYFNDTHYAVDLEGIMTVDKNYTGTLGTSNWNVANQRCIDAGKRLIPVEVLKAINDYGGQGGNLGFTNYHQWSSTVSSGSFIYVVTFSNGQIARLGSVGAFSTRVRCAL